MTDPIKYNIEDKVRHIKTCMVGVVLIDNGDGSYGVVVKTDLGVCETLVWSEKDMEPLDDEEFQLVHNLVHYKLLKTALNKQVEDAKAKYGAAEKAMQAYLERNAIQGTKRYANMQVSISGMNVYSSISEENKEIAFKEIEEMGRGEIIKRTIHPSTLESFVSELLDSGKKVPGHISYFMTPKLSFAKKK